MSQEAFPVIVVEGHECLGCGEIGVVCLEIGVKGGHQTLACQECINLIFSRANGAVEKKNAQEPEEEEIVYQESSEEPETIRVEVDVNEDDTNQ